VVILGAITTAAQATRALRAEREQNALRDAARLAKEQEATARHAAEAEQLRNEKQRWAREHLLPEINRLLLDLDIAGAFAQALEAEKYVPDDPNLIALWPRLSIVTSIETTPAGAEIYARCGGDPLLALFSGQTQIGANDNWSGGSALSAAFGLVGAFALPATSRDAALLVTLQPGSYTVQVSGVGDTTGVALIEVYEVPQGNHDS
jgi:hypothetical protein